MSNDDLRKQADRADNIADQTVDDVLKETLQDAAKEYRQKAAPEEPVYALFRGNTQLAGTFPTEREALNAALSEGLIPELQTAEEFGAHALPADYHIKKVEHPYEPQSGFNVAQEGS
jgi:DNA-binding phage protein